MKNHHLQFFTLINEPKHTVKVLDISRRAVSYWQDEGILESHEKGMRRKFNVVDVIWVSAAAILREFGVSASNLSSIQTHVLKKSKEELEGGMNVNCSVLEKAIFDILLFGKQIYFIVNRKGEGVICDTQTIEEVRLRKENAFHITLNLNEVIQDKAEIIMDRPELLEIIKGNNNTGKN